MAISHSYSRIYVVLVWKLSLKSREIGGTVLVEMKLILNLVEMNEIDFEFIFYHSSLIWLNLTVIYCCL